jgi:hypothetical protein
MEDDRLRGWKEIGQFLHASERTVQRWEQHLQLPIHRVDTAKSAIVFASRAELIAWQESADGLAATQEPLPHSDGSEAADAHQLPPAAVLNSAPRPGGVDSAITSRDGEVNVRPPLSLRRRHLVLAVLSVTLICVSLVIRWAISSNNPGARRSHTNPSRAASKVTPGTVGRGAMLVLRVEVGDSDQVTLGVRVGTIATCALANHRPLALSAEPTPRGVLLHAYNIQVVAGNPNGQLIEIGAMDLNEGATRTMTQGTEVVRVEWVKTLPAPPSK